MTRFEQFPKFCCHCSAWEGTRYAWFRLFGYGLHFRWVSGDYIPCFSERHGHVKVLKLGKLWIKGLKP